MPKAMILGVALAGIAFALPNPAAAAHWGDLDYTSCQYTLPADPACTNCYKKASAILWDIQGDWEAACRTTSHPQLGRVPDWCATALNQWGNWWVKCGGGGGGPPCPNGTCPNGACRSAAGTCGFEP
jgi:hypothetical protein